MSAVQQMMLGGSQAAPLYVDDVFASWLRTGTGATATVTTGIDLSTAGGMLWIKPRGVSADNNHKLINASTRNYLVSNNTGNEGASGVTFSTTAHTLPTYVTVNESNVNYVDWLFKPANKFFYSGTKSHTNGSASTVDLSSLGTVGVVMVKGSANGGDNWKVWHRSATSGKILYLNLTNAETTDSAISVSGTTLTIASSNATDTYFIAAFAHDTSADGIIQAGSYTGNGSSNGPEINLGWEPQFVLVKNATTGGAGYNWMMLDAMRGFVNGGNDSWLRANLSDAENASVSFGNPTATGFKVTQSDASVNGNGNTIIYLAIRRPNKPPTSGTQVYNAIAYTMSASERDITGAGFPPDFALTSMRDASGDPHYLFDRLRGTYAYLATAETSAESTLYTSLNEGRLGMDGIHAGGGQFIDFSAGKLGILHFFRRAPGVFDVVCYTGTGVAHAETHNLGVVPELMIVKCRSSAESWAVYTAATGNTKEGWLETNYAIDAHTTPSCWNNTTPTASVFSVGTRPEVNTSSITYVTYLFATKPGISFVGSYTGNGGTADSAGTSQTINCGFTAGARFVMLKCTSHTSDWVIVDTTRGLIAGNDPALSLNTTAAEVTTTDLLDPANEGFVVNQLASGTTSANFNVTGRTYIVLAFA